MTSAERRFHAAMKSADSYDDAAEAEEQLRQDQLDEEFAADSAQDDCDDPGDRVPY
jgi:response regulator of citrate/malate metabolism